MNTPGRPAPAIPATAMPAPLRPATPTQRAFAAALLDPAQPVPAGLSAWNGSDVGPRFAVYRNNVMHSLVSVLADSFPVLRQLVGDTFFSAMAQVFVCDHPPTSPLMHRYGEAFPAWLPDFEPATDLPYLADMARLEAARWSALYAADMPAIDVRTLNQALQSPARLAASALVLHPSLSVLQSAHAVVSLWQTHQLDDTPRDAQLATLRLDVAEAALVFRADDAVQVLALPAAEAGLAAALLAGHPLGQAQATWPQADLTQLLGGLLRHGLVLDLLVDPDVDALAHTPTADPGPHPH